MRYIVSVKFHQDFLKVEGDRITVGLRSKPVGGRANAELLRKIARHFGVPTSSVRIVSGARSRTKRVDVGE